MFAHLFHGSDFFEKDAWGKKTFPGKGGTQATGAKEHPTKVQCFIDRQPGIVFLYTIPWRIMSLSW
jgi:hypothetical protein